VRKTVTKAATAALRRLLGIELPIVQAPMAGAQGSALAVAVSNAGGLGSLPCAMLDLAQMRTQLTELRAATAGRPWSANFFCHAEPTPEPAREAKWRELLAPYYAQLEVPPDSPASGPARSPFSSRAADVLEEFSPPVVSFHFGLPAADLLARVKGWRATILSTATTVDEARWLEAHGVDVIVAQGLEAGGHRGSFLSEDLTLQQGTFALLPQIASAVSVPVLATGGIADARGVAAAIALGAAGVQVGTAYLLCREATPSAVHRAALGSDAARHTAITNLFSGRPARGIVNRLMRELGSICDAAPAFPLAATAIAPLRGRAESRGSGDFSPLWAGQNVTGCKEAPAGDLTRELAAGCASAR
jgi:nitronate monooxygenase